MLALQEAKQLLPWDSCKIQAAKKGFVFPAKRGYPNPSCLFRIMDHPPWSLVACVTGRGAGGLRANPSAMGGGRQELPSWGE